MGSCSQTLSEEAVLWMVTKESDLLVSRNVAVLRGMCFQHHRQGRENVRLARMLQRSGLEEDTISTSIPMGPTQSHGVSLTARTKHSLQMTN